MKKVAFIVRVILRALMGNSAETENTIQEILADSHVVERIREIVANNDQVLILDILGQMGGNGTVCDVLNSIRGPCDMRNRIIFDKVWRELSSNHQQCD